MFFSSNIYVFFLQIATFWDAVHGCAALLGLGFIVLGSAVRSGYWKVVALAFATARALRVKETCDV